MSDDGLDSLRLGGSSARGRLSSCIATTTTRSGAGQPHGRVALFERMSLEAFQSGLSWLIILRKRENFRRAFSGFDIEKVARYTDADVQRLMADPGIVRNRAKIDATIANARAAADLGTSEDLSELLWSFAPPQRPRPADLSEIPSATAESKAMAHELKRRGFRFVGPTTAYALMQATGMVDDHIRDLLGARARPVRPESRVFVQLLTRIGNNGGVIWQFNVGYGWKFTGGACSAPTRSAKAGQLELGGSTRWRR